MLLTKQLYPVQLPSGHILRPLGPDDSEAFFDLVINNRSHLSRFDAFVTQFHNVHEVTRALSQIQSFQEQNQSLTCGIWIKNRLVGYLNCGLNWEEKSVRIGYGLAEDQQGQGVMTQALRTILEFTLQKLELEYAWLICWTANTPSIKVAERLGFKRQAGSLPANPKDGIPDQFKYILRRS